ncbi:MAG: hypothetical protein U0835_12695 [Isosphaeraceae bacterium]
MSDPAARRPADTPDREREAGAFSDKDQQLFDAVVGPNLRLRDNLIQLVVIVLGTACGAGAGALYARSTGADPAFGAVAGGFAGVVASLLLSGAVIGLVRTILALRRPPRQR